MFKSPASIASWVIAILIVGGMGILVAHGPFHNVSKVTAQAQFSPVSAKIENSKVVTAVFVPSPLTVHPHQEIDYTNVSDALHTVSPVDGKSFVDSGDIGATGGKGKIFAPATPGTYKYYCKYHSDMHGILVVK